MPAAARLRSSSASVSAAVTSTLVTGSAATTSQRTGVGARADGVEHPLAEELGVGEEQRRIPAEQDQAGNLPRVRVALQVVKAR